MDFLQGANETVVELQSLCVDVLTRLMTHCSAYYTVIPFHFICQLFNELKVSPVGDYCLLYKDVSIWQGISETLGVVVLSLAEQRSIYFCLGGELENTYNIMSKTRVAVAIGATVDYDIVVGVIETATPELKVIHQDELNSALYLQKRNKWLPCMIRICPTLFAEYMLYKYKTGDTKNLKDQITIFNTTVGETVLAAIRKLNSVPLDLTTAQGKFVICAQVCACLMAFSTLEMMIVSMPTLVYILGYLGVPFLGKFQFSLSKNVIIWPGLSEQVIDILSLLLDTKSLVLVSGDKYAGLLKVLHPQQSFIPSNIKVFEGCPDDNRLAQIDKEGDVYWYPCFFCLSSAVFTTFVISSLWSELIGNYNCDQEEQRQQRSKSDLSMCEGDNKKSTNDYFPNN